MHLTYLYINNTQYSLLLESTLLYIFYHYVYCVMVLYHVISVCVCVYIDVSISAYIEYTMLKKIKGTLKSHIRS